MGTSMKHSVWERWVFERGGGEGGMYDGGVVIMHT
jgi:hypothetical protein